MGGRRWERGDWETWRRRYFNPKSKIQNPKSDRFQSDLADTSTVVEWVLFC